MADLEACFKFVLAHEDSTLSGVATKDPSKSDPNAIARFGINSAADPRAVADGFYTMDRDAALEYAATAFKYNYFSVMGGYQVKDQDLANKICDLAFNAGNHQAAKLVQRALNVVIAGPIAIDGIMGERTIEAVNAADPVALLVAIKDKAKDFYISLVAANPENQKFLHSWLARADA